LKAAVLTQLNSPLEILEVGTTPLKYGQVLVRVLASGICGSQLQEIAGYKGNAKYLPHLLGHEGCGIVEECGEGVSRVDPGDKVVMHWRVGAGIESEPPQYTLGDRMITSGRVTTFSEFSICSENRLTTVPINIPNELCALMGCGLSTALGTIEKDAEVRMGESVLVIGVGGLGCNLIRASSLAHATPIYAMDIIEEKAPLAEGMGAKRFAHQWSQLLFKMELQNIRGFDVVIDTTGNIEAIKNGMDLLNPSGRFIMVGQPKPNDSVEILNARHLFDGTGKSIKATQGGGFQPHLDIPRYLKLFSAGLLDISRIITHHFHLGSINRALDLVREGSAGRIIITP
jgi:S-(hydroxymethyl)glutathione dehydrogenase / alcohol dehydrogenase